MFNKHTNNVDFAVLGLCLGLRQRQEANNQINAAFSTLHTQEKIFGMVQLVFENGAGACVRACEHVCVCVSE